VTLRGGRPYRKDAFRNKVPGVLKRPGLCPRVPRCEHGLADHERRDNQGWVCSLCACGKGEGPTP
jgi:hypothetical protein